MSLPPVKDRLVSAKQLLANSGHVFDVSEDDAAFYQETEPAKPAEKVFDFGELYQQVNFDCIESSDPSATPFDELEKKMTDVTSDGKVKKRILSEGTVRIPENSAIRVHYNFYTEMDEVPFDSTYLRSKHPARFQMGDGSCFVGFELALNSMTVGEKSQFLIDPDLAFGRYGSPGRVPENARVMAIIHVVRLDNSPGEEPLTVNDRKNFDVAYRKAKGLNAEGNECFNEDQNPVRAVSYYRKAENLLVGCSMNNDDQEEKWKHLLVKIYMNMAVCYNTRIMNSPKKVCIAVRKAFQTDPSNASKNPKLFYNRGVAYMSLSEYKLAKSDLTRAKRLAPDDKLIQGKLEELNKKMREYKENEKTFCSLGFQIPSSSRPIPVVDVPDTIDDECKDAVSRLLEDFANGDSDSLDLTSEYTNKEKEWLKTESDRLSLDYAETRIGKKCSIIISKKIRM